MALQFRYVILALMFLAALTTDMSRSDINIAIVSMTEPIEEDVSLDVCPHSKQYDEEIELFETGNYTLGAEHHEVPEFHRRRYHWDQEVQGAILGSFFWAYMAMHIPGGIIAQRFGGKHVVCLSIIASAVITLATPFLTDMHVMVFIASRAIMGLFQGGFYPAAFGILCSWMPLQEKSLAFAILDSGSNIGSVLNFYFSGFIVIDYGWTMLFFMPGIVALVVWLFAFPLTSSTPKQSRFVSQREQAYINAGLEANADSKDPHRRTPWCHILSNKAVLSAGALKFAIGWNFSVFYMEMPKYLNEIIHEDIRSNGKINALINLLNGCTLMLTGMISEQIIRRGWLGRTTCRKVFSLFSGFAYGICMLLIPACGCDHAKLKCILFTCATLAGFAGGSDLPLASEMSINFPSTIYAVCNLIAMGAGSFVPVYTGIILTDIHDQWLGWSIVFYTSACLSLAACTFFLFCASADRQEFDFLDGEPRPGKGDDAVVTVVAVAPIAPPSNVTVANGKLADPVAGSHS